MKKKIHITYNHANLKQQIISKNIIKVDGMKI